MASKILTALALIAGVLAIAVPVGVAMVHDVQHPRVERYQSLRAFCAMNPYDLNCEGR